ncbi:MAG: DNA polymerase III subunit delta [Raoultibacter sp.]
MANTTKNDTLLPAYLVVGDDELKREAVMRRLKQRLSSLGDLSFNSDRFNGEVATAQDICAACNTMPFASEKRLVVVESADKLKKADTDAIVEYLKNPAETTVLALVAVKLAKNTRLYKAIAGLGKSAIIDCLPLKRFELPRAVRSMAVTHGITLTDAGAHALIENVGENTIALDSELKKIALAHRGGDAVSDREVNALIVRTAEVKPWEFVDAFSSRNLQKCLWCLGRMESTSPHALLAMCTTRLRELICARALYDRGAQARLAAVLKLPDWRVKNHISWARSFTAAELRGALVRARDAERSMKSGGDPDAVFLEWILSAIGHTLF